MIKSIKELLKNNNLEKREVNTYKLSVIEDLVTIK